MKTFIVHKFHHIRDFEAEGFQLLNTLVYARLNGEHAGRYRWYIVYHAGSGLWVIEQIKDGHSVVSVGTALEVDQEIKRMVTELGLNFEVVYPSMVSELPWVTGWLVAQELEISS